MCFEVCGRAGDDDGDCLFCCLGMGLAGERGRVAVRPSLLLLLFEVSGRDWVCGICCWSLVCLFRSCSVCRLGLIDEGVQNDDGVHVGKCFSATRGLVRCNMHALLNF